VEGIQAHTESLWGVLRDLHIPVILFVNKTDRVGADAEAVIHAIKKELKVSPMPLQELSGERGK
jgi:ribosomal protection tetracycline resistance protein